MIFSGWDRGVILFDASQLEQAIGNSLHGVPQSFSILDDIASRDIAADKTANRCKGVELSGCHCASRLRTASVWRGSWREARSGETATEME